MKTGLKLTIALLLQVQFCGLQAQALTNGPHRVIVTSDIGGTDFDDFQSMAHLLLYADTFAIEGMIASPYGEGRKEDILETIAAYEIDYSNLSTYSDKYPTADSLRKLVKKGALELPTAIGYDVPTEGSNWIIERAKIDDPRPLNILIWGGIEDLAQALHDAPEILPKLRVYFIGGPNKKWTVNAYQYIAENHKDLWMIEANSTYRGWFLGGTQNGEWGNSLFVKTYVRGFGALGDYFNSKGGEVKMGDTPSLMRLAFGDPDDPTKPSWGGQFVRAWERPHKVFDRITTDQDSLEQFGVLELQLSYSENVSNPQATMNIDRPIEGLVENGKVKFLFSPKDGKKYPYTISSNIGSLNNLTGDIVAYRPPAFNKQNPSQNYPNWWTDDPSEEYVENNYIGVKTLNIYREDFLQDFADRMYRCAYLPNTFFKLETVAEHGSIEADIEGPSIKAGTRVTLTAVADEGYEFLQWEGDVEGNKPTLTLVMDSDKNVIASFLRVTATKSQRQAIIFPTVIEDHIHVSMINIPPIEKTIQLIDLSGRVLDKYYVGTQENEITINVNTDLRQGVFIMRIEYGASAISQRLVKR